MHVLGWFLSEKFSTEARPTLKKNLRIYVYDFTFSGWHRITGKETKTWYLFCGKGYRNLIQKNKYKKKASVQIPNNKIALFILALQSPKKLVATYRIPHLPSILPPPELHIYLTNFFIKFLVENICEMWFHFVS